MSGLAVGLAVGFGAAGGIAAYSLGQFGNLGGAFLPGIMRERRPLIVTNPKRDAISGAVLGALIGGGAGLVFDGNAASAFNSIVGNNDTATTTSCTDLAKPGATIKIEKDGSCTVTLAP